MPCSTRARPRGSSAWSTLLYVATKMFSFTERALHTIAGSGQQTPRFSRALGYVALLLMAPAVRSRCRACWSRPCGSRSATASTRRWARSRARDRAGRGAGAGPAVAGGHASSTGRRCAPASRSGRPPSGGRWRRWRCRWCSGRTPTFRSACRKAGVVGGGFAAFPVFLLWVFSSWYTLLICAEIAVAHRVDVVLVHGARALSSGPRRRTPGQRRDRAARGAGGARRATARGAAVRRRPGARAAPAAAARARSVRAAGGIAGCWSSSAVAAAFRCARSRPDGVCGGHRRSRARSRAGGRAPRGGRRLSARRARRAVRRAGAPR